MVILQQDFSYHKNLPILVIITFLSIITILFIVDYDTISTNTIYAYTDQNNPVLKWNTFTTNASLEHKLSPPALARAYALVHVSIYDALLSSKNVDSENFTGKEKEIVNGAASEVLSYLYPDMKERIDSFSLTPNLQSNNNTGGNYIASDAIKASKAFQFGQSVGKHVISYAKTDGSDSIFNGTIPVGECKWTGTNPLEPMAGQWKTFIINSGAKIQPPPPLDCKSDEYKKQVLDIIEASKNRTSKQLQDIHFWGDYPPPAIWNSILNANATSYGLNVTESARAFAYLNIGMYDAGVSTWYTKFKYWTERPFQAVPGLVTEIPTPNFPGYTSGHSTFSGAASIILSKIFPQEKEFYESCADDANLSRFSGGIHLMQDCEEGLKVGKMIGNKVVEDMKGTPHTFIFDVSDKNNL
jgi:hypothetical protein